MSKELLQQALDDLIYLKQLANVDHGERPSIIALRAALAALAAQQQEPVAIGSLPLGARFSYQENPDIVWCLLERHGSGKCARWEGPSTDSRVQPVCSVSETPEDMLTLRVIPCDTTPPAPPAREWVGLSEKELWLAIEGCANKYEACRVVMHKLREKNAEQAGEK